MKKILLFSILITAIALMSCKDDSTISEQESQLTFNVSLPAPPSAMTKVADVTRYILEIYKASDLNTVLHRIEQSGGTFTIPLTNNISYTCLFWADKTAVDDNANGVYNALDLKNVTLNPGKEMEEAFFARLDVVNDDVSFNVTLKRPTAKINIIENTAIDIGSTVVVTHDHYNSFNALTSEIAGTAVSKDITITTSTTTGIIGSYLTFAPVVGNTTNFTSLYNNTISNTIPNIPLSANFITNIKGHYPGEGQSFTFIILVDDVWEPASVTEGVHINIGTTEVPNWIMVADRNAQKSAINGAAPGNSNTNYGSYYQWSSLNNNPANTDRSYSACFNFGEGNGTWRVPTLDEWTAIIGPFGTVLNSARKLQHENSVWKLYDERAGSESKFVYFPEGGNNVGPGTDVGSVEGIGLYWTSSRIANNEIGYWSIALQGDYSVALTQYWFVGCSVRCIRDIQE